MESLFMWTFSNCEHQRKKNMGPKLRYGLNIGIGGIDHMATMVAGWIFLQKLRCFASSKHHVDQTPSNDWIQGCHAIQLMQNKKLLIQLA